MAEKLILDIDFDITAAEAKQKKLNAQWEQQNIKVEQQKQKVAELNSQLQELTSEESRQKAILDSKVDITVQEAERYETIAAKAAEVSAEYDRQEARLTLESANLQDIGSKIKLSTQKTKEYGSAWKSAGKHTRNNMNSLEKFGRRIKELVKSALLFSVLTKVLNGVKEQFANIVKQDAEVLKQWNQLKGSMTVAGSALYDAFRPVIKWLIENVNYFANVLTYIITKISGKSIDSAKKIAKSTAKTADNVKEIKKTTAGFDTLQTAPATSESSNATSGSIDVSGIKPLTDDMLARTTAFLAGAGSFLLVVGAILAFSGANISLGITMMVTGGLLLYGAESTKDTLTNDMRNKISGIMDIGGSLLLVIGLILCFTGHIPLGIGLLIAGGSMIYASRQMNSGITDDLKSWITGVELIGGWLLLTIGIILCFFSAIPLGVGMMIAGCALVVKATSEQDKMTPKVKQKISTIMGIGGTLLLVIGIMLLFTPAIPLGMGMILAGAGMLYGAVKLSSGDTIMEKVNNLAANIRNVFRSLINFIIKALNKISFTVPDWVPGLGGKKIGFNIKELPMLANGAVIPGGKPFYAMLGDQPKGQTNIEAPLDTLIEAFKAAQMERNVNIRFSGNLSELGRVLKPVLDDETRRATAW